MVLELLLLLTLAPSAFYSMDDTFRGSVEQTESAYDEQVT